MGYKITIDGLAASGKGTLARRIAKELNILYIDSGMIYRALGLYVIRNHIDISNDEQINNQLLNADVKLKPTLNGPRIYIGIEDVSNLIRTEQVAAVTSKVAKIKTVRAKVLSIQRAVSEGANVIMEGRDIGSEVFPDAELKIYLTASLEERATRRYNELISKGKDTTLEEVKKQIIDRDHEDITREISPLVKTDDMIEIDSTDLTEEQVLEKVKQHIVEKGLGCF